MAACSRVLMDTRISLSLSNLLLFTRTPSEKVNVVPTIVFAKVMLNMAGSPHVGMAIRTLIHLSNLATNSNSLTDCSTCQITVSSF